MALSTGQFAIHCQLCESNTKIQWKCIDCNLLICDTCKEKIHPKFKNAKDHRIIDIKDLKNQEICVQQTQPDLTPVKKLHCKEHIEKLSSSFCESCNCFLCLKCALNHDTSHNIMDIHEGFEAKRKDLIERKSQLDKNKDGITSVKQQLGQILEAEEVKYSNMKRDIYDHQTYLHKAIDMLTDEFIAELEKHWDSVKSVGQRGEQLIGRLQEDISQKGKELDKLVSCENAEQFFQAWLIIEDLEQDPIMPQELQYGSLPKFIRGEFNKDNFGTFVKLRKPESIKTESLELELKAPELSSKKSETDNIFDVYKHKSSHEITVEPNLDKSKSKLPPSPPQTVTGWKKNS